MNIKYALTIATLATASLSLAEDKPEKRPTLHEVPHNDRVIVYGYVLQRQEDGMLVSTQKNNNASSMKRADGIVWVEGKTFPDDTWVRLTCKADGTYSYSAVSGASKIVDAYIWLDGGKTGNIPSWAR